MVDHQYRSARTTVILALVKAAIAERVEVAGSRAVEIVDAGGGTGGVAVPLALAGHQVTVVDPSPNALAALERRVADAGVTGLVKAVQGDAAGLASVVGEHSADVVLCHGVLEVADEPAEAVRGVAAVVRPDGFVSVLVAQRYGAVLARAAAGHLRDAAAVLNNPDGHWGEGDPLPRRFDEPALARLLESAGLTAQQAHGVRVTTELLPGGLLDEPAGAQALAELEAALATHPAFRAVAGQLHVIATP